MLEPDFWPTEAGGWSVLVASIVTAILAVGGAIYKSGRLQQKFEDQVKDIKEELELRFKSQGERIGGLEKMCNRHHSTTQDLHTTTSAQQFQIDTNAREVGRISGAIEQLGNQIIASNESRGKLAGEVRERLARLEERIRMERTK